jgi:hypothetical protein
VEEDNDREGMEMMSPHLQNRNAPSKNCTISGCGGMMTLHRPQEVGSDPQTLEGAAGATWVCNTDLTHTEPAEE